MKRIATAVCVVLLLAACGESGSRAAQSNDSGSVTTAYIAASDHARFADFGLSFDYPSTWRSQPYSWASSFETSITYLSPMALHDPCTRTSLTGGVQISCDAPVDMLDPASVLVTWTNVGFPHAAGEPEVASPNTTIAGRSARVVTDSPGTCASVAADRTISATIERPAGNVLTMTACLREPGVDANSALVQQMLSSVEIA